jgi:peptide/nickel transport system substrate-binding protein
VAAAQTPKRGGVFRLRGVRWHPKPPVNGRELTAEGVKYTYDRFLGTRANRNRGVLEPVERVDVLDPQTVRFSLLEHKAPPRFRQ